VEVSTEINEPIGLSGKFPWMLLSFSSFLPTKEISTTRVRLVQSGAKQFRKDHHHSPWRGGSLVLLTILLLQNVVCVSGWTMSRRSWINSVVKNTGVMVASVEPTTSPVWAVDAGDNNVVGGGQSNTAAQVFQLPSGLKYIDLVPGTGPTPMYGQLCSIAYKGYIKLPASKEDPDPKPQLFGQSKAYLMKHGNARTIPGLDQGLHTMKVGGTRRLIIPAKLGYVTSGLGPLPPSPWDRYRLNSLLDDMVRLQGGNLVFEVTLLSAIDDEADQGYYNDGSLTPEEFETLRTNIQQKAKK
jgi:hypothetical protein